MSLLFVGSYCRDFPLKSSQFEMQSLKRVRIYQTMAKLSQVRATLLKVAGSAIGSKKPSSGKVLK
jgi:hypothetical protein